MSRYSPRPAGVTTVRCTSGCPVCDLPGGDSFDLVGERIVPLRRIEACSAIAAERATRVLARGGAKLRSGGAVALGNGFEVHADGVLAVAIDAETCRRPDLVPGGIKIASFAAAAEP